MHELVCPHVHWEGMAAVHWHPPLPINYPLFARVSDERH